ncbi:hypothetical protein ACERK3_14525 [Phycisphaerales bacterium AB-hyl4]|uniref:Uncharacterized protein n=1 Tax=Natronomicrosphaera hydrolytica TaxID=3242702 RepID=A0ABV4U9V3_9BACT
MKHLIVVISIILLSIQQVGHAHGSQYEETFEDYSPTILTRNANNAFGNWRTVLMDGQSEIGPAAAGATPGNDTQTLRFSTVNTDRASAIDNSPSFTEGVITLAFDFVLESATGSNSFFYANATDGANAGSQTTLFKLTAIRQSDQRFRVGTEADVNRFSGTSDSQTLAFGQWYRFHATIDLDAGRFDWHILDSDGEPTRIRFDNLDINADSDKALQSIWFGKIGAANDLTGAIDNINITNASEASDADDSNTTDDTPASPSGE